MCVTRTTTLSSSKFAKAIMFACVTHTHTHTGRRSKSIAKRQAMSSIKLECKFIITSFFWLTLARFLHERPQLPVCRFINNRPCDLRQKVREGVCMCIKQSRKIGVRVEKETPWKRENLYTQQHRVLSWREIKSGPSNKQNLSLSLSLPLSLTLSAMDQ